jgi:hypothetical protein
MMKPIHGNNRYASHYRIVNYFDRLLTALCEMYLHKYHCVLLSPTESMFPLYKRFLRRRRDRKQEIEIAKPYMSWVVTVSSRAHLDKDLDLESFAMRSAESYFEQIGDNVEVESVVFVVRYPVSE